MGEWMRAACAHAHAADAAPRMRLWALVTGLLMSTAVAAQQGERTAIAPFTGTLQKIYESGVVLVGHRANSPPFAFLDARRKPIGYSLDLCEAIIEEIEQHLRRSIEVRHVPVTPADRFEKVSTGAVDLECGSTTANAERRALVDFSATIFVTGTKLLVRRGSGIRSLRDLQDKTVVLTHGTIQSEAIPRIAERQKLAIRFVFANDHDESFRVLTTGAADAFANDDVQLHGMVAARDAAADWRVVGDFITYADYALMFRRGDAEFAEVVRQAFDRMAASGEILAIYRRWFQRPLPSGANLNLPMSPHLEHVFRLQGRTAD
jgi:glutamate/aspartate transport system substrate-binding protein